MHLFTQPKPESVYKTAKMLSDRDCQLWYVMDHTKCDPVAVTENNLKRYMQLGYKVACCYCNGERHKNAFFDRDLGKYVFTEY